MFLNKLVWAHSVDPENPPDQSLHCLPCHLHLLDAFAMIDLVFQTQCQQKIYSVLPPLFPKAMLINLSCILSALGLMSRHGLLPIPIVANSDRRFSETSHTFILSYDAVIQRITSCHKNRMTTRYITFWRVRVMS